MTEECRCHIRQHEGRRAEDREEAQAREKARDAFLEAWRGSTHAVVALDAALSAYREALCEIALRRLGVRGTR